MLESLQALWNLALILSTIIVIFLIGRSIVLWYWRVNEIASLLQKQINRLDWQNQRLKEIRDLLKPGSIPTTG